MRFEDTHNSGFCMFLPCHTPWGDDGTRMIILLKQEIKSQATGAKKIPRYHGKEASRMETARVLLRLVCQNTDLHKRARTCQVAKKNLVDNL